MNDGKKRASASPRSGAVWLIVLNLVAIFWIRDEILDLVGQDQAGNGEAQLRVVALSPEKGEDADDADIRQMRSVLKRRQIDPSQALYVHFALGKAFDDCKMYYFKFSI